MNCELWNFLTSGDSSNSNRPTGTSNRDEYWISHFKNSFHHFHLKKRHKMSISISSSSCQDMSQICLLIVMVMSSNQYVLPLICLLPLPCLRRNIWRHLVLTCSKWPPECFMRGQHASKQADFSAKWVSSFHISYVVFKQNEMMIACFHEGHGECN